MLFVRDNPFPGNIIGYFNSDFSSSSSSISSYLQFLSHFFSRTFGPSSSCSGYFLSEWGKEKKKKSNRKKIKSRGLFHLEDEGRGRRRRKEEGGRRGGTIWFEIFQRSLETISPFLVGRDSLRILPRWSGN